MLDYIIVGLGLSGTAVSALLEEGNKSFIVFEDYSQKSSKVAAGSFNPVILKRFTLAWHADVHLEEAIPFYRKMEEKLQAKLIHFRNIYRKFHSAEEQNNWFQAADNSRLAPFLDTNLLRKINRCISGEFSFGRVLQTGNIDTGLLLKKYQDYLKEQDRIRLEKFDYDVLRVQKEYIEYGGWKARQIIFCEGFGLVKNPFFNYLPLRGNKGEYIIIQAKDLKLEQAVKSSSFIIPLGNDRYKVGATYDHKDKTSQPTPGARKNLKLQVESLINCDFEIIGQEAGIRPATSDRRPLLGRHPRHKNLFCCNGFGSRGVLMAPAMAKELLNFAEEGVPLDPETDISRFTAKHYKG